MEVVDALKHAELGNHAQRALHAARDTVSETVAPNVRDLAERAHADRYVEQIKHLEKRYAKRARRLERKLEKRAKKLPVDTPLDRRRRSRERKRGAQALAVVVVAAMGAAIAYVAWRARRGDDPDAESFDRFEPADESSSSAYQGNGGAVRERLG